MKLKIQFLPKVCKIKRHLVVKLQIATNSKLSVYSHAHR